jgi:hypothetical protein
MMLKVLVYAYSQRVYSSRQIAKALRENIHYIWISGGNQPDFRTINRFRGVVMKEVIEAVFALVLELLIDEGYVKLENYFVDGTKVEANANRHKVVWAKSRQKYEERLRQKVKAILEEVDEVNAAEDERYGDEDPDDPSGKKEIDSQKLEQKIRELNERLKQKADDKKLAKAVKTLSQDCLPRQRKYEEQKQKLAGRNSYAKTDEEATFMRMKEDRGAEKPLPRPAYNLQMGTEGQFVVGFSVHQRAGDTACLIPHLEGLKAQLGGRLPKQIVADAGYGSEENYAYLQDHHLESYVKYASFHRQQHKHRKPELIQRKRFLSENFPYDPQTDQFICPANQPLTYRYTGHEKSENGYPIETRHYEASACNSCALKAQCTRAKGNRHMRVSFQLQEFRRQASQNLLSEQGKQLRSRRSTEVETVFGDIKHNRRFRRFMLRGLQKVKTEWGLVCLAHNIQKLAA